ncbi:hypothetical protein WH47_07306, partial [Habropoda laboriosa]
EREKRRRRGRRRRREEIDPLPRSLTCSACTQANTHATGLFHPDAMLNEVLPAGCSGKSFRLAFGLSLSLLSSPLHFASARLTTFRCYVDCTAVGSVYEDASRGTHVREAASSASDFLAIVSPRDKLLD